MMREALVIAGKDFRLEARTRERLSSMVIFSLMVVLSFRFAFGFFDIRVDQLQESRSVVAAILWVTFFFAGMLGLAPAFAKEADAGTINGLLLVPTSRFALYLGKLASSLVFIFVVSLSTIVFFAVFFNYDYSGQWGPLIAVTLLGTLGYSSIGVTVSALSASAKTRDILLPMLLIAVALFTVIVPSINATVGLLSGDIDAVVPSVVYVGAFTVIALLLSYLLFDDIVED